MRRIVLALVLVVATSAHAQLVPVGGMTAGCPSSWGHREGGPTSFSCADTSSGAFCNGRYVAATGASQADEAAAARARILAMGFVIRSESDVDGMHVIEHDDTAGHRIAVFVRSSVGRTLVVTCGADPSAFAAALPTFTAVATSAR